MVGWHHRLNGREFAQTLGDSEGQGSLACCNSWGCKESDTISDRTTTNVSDSFSGALAVIMQSVGLGSLSRVRPKLISQDCYFLSKNEISNYLSLRYFLQESQYYHRVVVRMRYSNACKDFSRILIHSKYLPLVL